MYRNIYQLCHDTITYAIKIERLKNPIYLKIRSIMSTFLLVFMKVRKCPDVYKQGIIFHMSSEHLTSVPYKHFCKY